MDETVKVVSDKLDRDLALATLAAFALGWFGMAYFSKVK